MFGDTAAALMGLPGPLYRVRGEGFKAVMEPHGMSLIPTHPDHGVVQNLCAVATNHLRVLYFVKKYYGDELDDVDATEEISGYYSVLAENLMKLLQPFRSTVLELERDCRKPENQSFVHMFDKIRPYTVLLEHLQKMCFEVDNLQNPGCQILNVIEEYRDCGIPVMKKVCCELLKPCRVLFLQSLCSWVLAATGPARMNDFFIGGADFDLCSIAIPKNHSNETAGSEKFVRFGQGQDNIFPKGYQSHSEGDRTGSTLSTRSMRHMNEKHGTKDCVTRAPELCVIPTQVPYHITLRRAETIANMARNVRLLKLFSRERGTDHYEQVAKLHSSMLARLMEVNEEDEQETFNEELEEWVDAAKNVSDRQMVRMVLEDGRLVETCLTVVKDYFLMGYGVFHAELIKGIDKVIEFRKTNSDIHYLQTRIDDCVADVVWDLHIDGVPDGIDFLAADENGQPIKEMDDERQRTRIRQRYKEFTQHAEDSLDGQNSDRSQLLKKPGAEGKESWTIDVTVQLPSNLIVTEEIIAAKYRPVYNVITKVRTTSNALHSLWLCRMKSKPGVRRPQDVCLLMEMMYLVRHVLSFAEWYFEEQYAELLERIRDCAKSNGNGSLDLLQQHHTNFVLAIGTFASELFLNVLNKILEACNAYCKRCAGSLDGYPPPSVYHRCNKIEETFAMCVAQFMQYSQVVNRQPLEAALKEMTSTLCANSHIVGKYAMVAVEKLNFPRASKLTKR